MRHARSPGCHRDARLCYTRSPVVFAPFVWEGHRRLAIFGAGAVGASVGGRLAQAGAQGAWLARGDHLHTLARHGWRVESPHGDGVIQAWLATDDPTQVGIRDVGVVGVNTWQLLAVASALPRSGGPKHVCGAPAQWGGGADALRPSRRRTGGPGGCSWVMSVRGVPGHIRPRVVFSMGRDAALKPTTRCLHGGKSSALPPHLPLQNTPPKISEDWAFSGGDGGNLGHTWLSKAWK